jgi:hypothetical protein
MVFDFSVDVGQLVDVSPAHAVIRLACPVRKGRVWGLAASFGAA